MALHYRQSNPGACLPACARMVLAVLGDERTEADLAKVMGSYDYGTPAYRITWLEKWGYQVKYGPTGVEALEAHLEQGLLPIAFVHAEFLPWADFEGPHAVVVTEITAGEVAVLDPALAAGPSRLSREAFLAAWGEFDFRAGVVRPSA